MLITVYRHLSGNDVVKAEKKNYKEKSSGQSRSKQRTETAMAFMNSLNYHKPFLPLLTEPKNPNFNSIKFNPKNPNQPSRFRFPTRRIVPVNGSLQNSDQNTSQGPFFTLSQNQIDLPLKIFIFVVN